MSEAKISRDDLEGKFREVKTGIDERTGPAKSAVVPAAVAGGILVLLLMYLLGRRVGVKKSAIVEIRRI